MILTIKELLESGIFRVINDGGNHETVISKPFACDLLSIAMSKAGKDSAWFTVMGNVNTIAVCALADCACIVLCEGTQLDETASQKAAEQDITVLSAGDKPIFDAAMQLYEAMK